MTPTKLVAIFVAVAGSLLYLNSYFSQPETWEGHNNKALSAFRESHYAEAEKHFVQALKLAETFYDDDHRLSFSLNQLAEIYQVQSKFVEAGRVLKRSLAIDEKKFGPKHLNVALRLNNLAGNYRMRGNYEEAESLLKRALKILEESLGKEHSLVANILEHYAYLLQKMGKPVEAQSLERRYKAIYSVQDSENQ
jgi:tetratricopeptide (TPR) repeat protein